MGAYVNPAGETKETWLEREGKPILEGEARNFFNSDWGDEHKDHLPVCLVQNSAFSAAAVGFSKEEISCFCDPYDRRPRKWYSVPIDKLLESSDPSLKYYLERSQDA